jgi:hypothetical protein
MAFIMDSPLLTTNTPEQNERDKKLWESEDLGGITEDNNRMPVPVVWLLILTIFTAFAITFPLWGQRPTALIYSGMIKDLDDPAIQALDDETAMARIIAKHKGDERAFQIERHPVSMDTLRSLKPQIEDLQKRGENLEDWTVVGTRIVQANFEGNVVNGKRERHQPWWDKGYTIDIFYVLYFFFSVVMIVKRLPPYTWQPTHGHEH